MYSESVVTQVLERLELLQDHDLKSFPKGIFPSYRYHKLLPYRRADDNVYFTSFIIISLKKCLDQLSIRQKEIADRIINEAEISIFKYKSRLGYPVYNFYRPKGYFPNGYLLSKYKKFQPTDDSDDTAIAYRAVNHSKEEALSAKKILIAHCNGSRGNWNTGSLAKYQKERVYNTWIGSKELYVDIDICVIANILCFNAQYRLGIDDIDLKSLSLIEDAIISGDYLRNKNRISAWYPIDEVIFYQISELFSTKYYNIRPEIKSRLIEDIRRIKSNDNISKLLLDIALVNLGEKKISRIDMKFIDSYIENSASFSYGTIPLLHTFRGNISRKLRFNRIVSKSFFQLRFECEAQRLAILLEWMSSDYAD